MTHAEHLETMCSRTADLVEAAANYTVIVGEWSLGTKTYCVDYQSKLSPLPLRFHVKRDIGRC